ncbi:MAG: hypothetical protein L6300_16515 [Syntrophaceae bacterium]|nr:hypothetical protein [Pseudomonadota bacterium]MCG2741822.1 hypothetical protein [Syntrophaceae bacterium]
MGQMMTSRSISFTVMVFACLFLLTVSGYAETPTRDEVIANASMYANLKWFCEKKNARKDYNLLTPGKQYRGVPYNWGGFDTTDKFEKKVKKGVVAGNYRKRCGSNLCVREDFAGLDCSGLVSRSWGISRYSTTTFPGISIKITRELLQPGDILNSANKHVMLFDKFDDDNQMWVYEAAAWVRIKNAPPAGVIYRSVDVGDDYVPRRYYKFIETGERIKTDKTIVALRQLNGKEKLYISAGTTGEILKGPALRSKAQKARTPSDVWVYVKFGNSKEGWVSIRHLTLVGVKT